jgi:hypothetical protein
MPRKKMRFTLRAIARLLDIPYGTLHRYSKDKSMKRYRDREEGCTRDVWTPGAVKAFQERYAFGLGRRGRPRNQGDPEY